MRRHTRSRGARWLGDSACSEGFSIKERCRHGVATWGYRDPLAEPELEPREAVGCVCHLSQISHHRIPQLQLTSRLSRTQVLTPQSVGAFFSGCTPPPFAVTIDPERRNEAFVVVSSREHAQAIIDEPPKGRRLDGRFINLTLGSIGEYEAAARQSGQLHRQPSWASASSAAAGVTSMQATLDTWPQQHATNHQHVQRPQQAQQQSQVQAQETPQQPQPQMQTQQTQQTHQADSEQPMTRAHVDFKLVRLKERVLETALKGEAPPPELLAEVKKYQDMLDKLVAEDIRQKQQEALARGMNPFDEDRCLCRMPGESCNVCYRGKGFHRARERREQEKEAKLERELRNAGHDPENFKVVKKENAAATLTLIDTNGVAQTDTSLHFEQHVTPLAVPSASSADRSADGEGPSAVLSHHSPAVDNPASHSLDEKERAAEEEANALIASKEILSHALLIIPTCHSYLVVGARPCCLD